MNIEATLWYALLLDSVVANLIAWFCPQWYETKLPWLHKFFPLKKSWCLVYLVLTLWLGCVLHRQEVLPW